MAVGASRGAEREQVWLHVCEALDSGLSGRGAVALLTGPAGIGKSELLRAARSRAQSAGMQTLDATGRADERDFAFGVARQLLESKLAADDRGPLLTRRATDDRPLGVEVLHRLYLACAELADQAPLALFVDDAHHADAQSIAFLIHIARRLDDLPIAVVAAAGSPSGAARGLELDELVAGCAHGVRCALTPLSAPATAARVRLQWPDATDDACRDIHERSGGNPFVVDTLVGARARPGGDAATAIAGWALTRSRDAHRDADLLLRAGAILGTGCRLRQAGALAGLDPGEAALIADRLGEAGIVRPGEPLRFEQPVVAEAIEAMLGPGERSAAHLSAARLLDADGTAPEDVAAHLLETIPAGHDWVVDVLEQAAAEALEGGAPARAVRYLRRALDEPPSAERRSQVVLALGHAEAISGEPGAAERLSASAAEFATDTRTEPMAALSTGRALLALGQANEAIAVLEGALAEATDGATADRLRADHIVARWLTRLPQGGATVSGDPPAGVDTPGDRALLALHAIERALRGTHSVRVRELALSALGSGALLDDGTADGLTFYMAAAALAVSEDLAGAEAALTAAVDEAEARGSVLGLATVSAVRAFTVLLAGRVHDAARDARRGIAAERHGWRVALGDARVVLAHSLMETGDVAGADRQLRLGDAVVPDGHLARIPLLLARGRLHSLAGNADEARASFLEGGELAEKAGVHNPALAPWRSGAGLALAALGDPAEGRQLIATELSLAESFGAPGPVGRALRAQASTHAPREALELLEVAVETLEGSQVALERARTLVDFGAALRRANHRREAREPLRAGLETAQRCGAEVLARRAMRELTAAGARPRRVAQTGPDALTARERQVGALASQGLSNRQIAKTLVVTVKTVEWHLKHAYRKLGIESRGQLPGFFPAEERRANGDRRVAGERS